MTRPIYVEIAIARPQADVWERTQDRALHERWDEAEQRFRIDVSVTNPRYGPLFGYRGWFEVEELPGTDVPGHLRPRREERRE